MQSWDEIPQKRNGLRDHPTTSLWSNSIKCMYTGLDPTMPKNVHTSVEIEADGYDGLDSNKINGMLLAIRCKEDVKNGAMYANMQCETWYRVKSAKIIQRLYATCSLMLIIALIIVVIL